MCTRRGHVDEDSGSTRALPLPGLTRAVVASSSSLYQAATRVRPVILLFSGTAPRRVSYRLLRRRRRREAG